MLVTLKNKRKKKKERREQEKRETLQLRPSDELQERVASLEEIEKLITTSPNPRFVEYATSFRGEYQDGDIILEYCTDKTSWREYRGSAGYVLRRDGEDISRLSCKMN